MQNTILGPIGIAFIALYLVSLLVIGWLANRARQENTLKDYYLAGSSLGSLSLFFTLYATQYSGNTLFAIPGNAYRNGFIGLSVAAAVMAVVLVYFLFASRLNILAKQHGFISVGDFIKWRYNNKALLIAINSIAIVTLVSYALGNFKAIGLLLETASGGVIPFAAGILILGAIMAVYESLGGLRGVVWTDIIQGSLLFVGCLLLFFAVTALNPAVEGSGLTTLGSKMADYFTHEIDLIGFMSVMLLVGIGAAVYPQALQRIYIARNPSVLRKSYIALFFMPLLTTVPMILVGISVAEWLPGLSTAESENVVVYAIGHITRSYPSVAWLLVLYLGAAVAAIMSTIDSALLSLGSTVTKDIFGRAGRQIEEENLYKISRMTSWVLMTVMVILAIALPQTIWALMIFKFELLIQIAPAIIMGVRTARVRGSAILWGLICGCIVAIALKTISLGGMDLSAPLGLHAGVWALGINLLVVFTVNVVKSASDSQSAKALP